VSMVDLLKPAQSPLSGRFLLTGLLPTVACGIFLIGLLAAGAPGRDFSPQRAWAGVAALGNGQLLILGLAVVLTALVMAPLQLALVRLLEGGWPAWLCREWARRRQRRRRDQSADRARITVPSGGRAPTDWEVQRAGSASVELQRRFPRAHLIRETALGNVLAAMEDTAGRVYGMDAVVAWPRLYPVLSPTVRMIVDARRDALDTATQLAVSGAVTGVVALALLVRTGPWILLAGAPLVLSVVAYRGAVQVALAYAEAVCASFDLHRFDLLRLLHLPLPADHETEMTLNTTLCLQWRQQVPLEVRYRHDEPTGG